MSSLGAVRTATGGLVRHKVQAVVLGMVLLVSTASATLGLALLAANNGPFQQAFNAQRGAQLTVSANPARAGAAQLAQTRSLAGVTALAGPFASTDVPTQWQGQDYGQLNLVGRPAPGGPVDDVVLNAGHWASGPGQIVLNGTPGDGGPVVGSAIVVDSVPRHPVTLTVVGFGNSITNTADGWVAPAQVAALTGPGSPASAQLLYRFTSAATAAQIHADLAEVTGALPAGTVIGSDSWLAAESQSSGNGAIMEPFVVAFALIGLAMAVLIVANVVSGAVAASYYRIGVLKSVGLTPAQVVVVYLSRVGGPAVAGCVLGVVVGNLLAIPVLKQSAQVYGVGSQALPWWASVLAPVAMLVLTMAAAFVPALRAGRLSATQAIAAGRAPASGRGYGAYRLASRLRLPRPVGMGLAAPFTRPARTLVSLAAIAFGATAVIFAFGLSASLGRASAIQTQSATVPVKVEQFGPSGGPGGGPGQQASSPAQVAQVDDAIRAQPGTAHQTTVYWNQVKAAGVPGNVNAWAFSNDAAWIGYGIITGHWYNAPGQVDVNTAFLNDSGLVHRGHHHGQHRYRAGHGADRRGGIPSQQHPDGVRQHADAARPGHPGQPAAVGRGAAAGGQPGRVRAGPERLARVRQLVAGHHPGDRRQVLHHRDRPGRPAGPDGGGGGRARGAQHGADDDPGPRARPGHLQGARDAARSAADHGGVLDRGPGGGGRGHRGAGRGGAQHGHRARHGGHRAHRDTRERHPGVPAVPAGAALAGRAGHRGGRGAGPGHLGGPGPARSSTAGRVTLESVV